MHRLQISVGLRGALARSVFAMVVGAERGLSVRLIGVVEEVAPSADATCTGLGGSSVRSTGVAR
jgi:hypothetical protein